MTERVISKILLIVKWISRIAWYFDEWLMYANEAPNHLYLQKRMIGKILTSKYGSYYTILHPSLPQCDEIIGITFAYRNSLRILLTWWSETDVVVESLYTLCIVHLSNESYSFRRRRFCLFLLCFYLFLLVTKNVETRTKSQYGVLNAARAQ